MSAEIHGPAALTVVDMLERELGEARRLLDEAAQQDVLSSELQAHIKWFLARNQRDAA